MVTTEPSGSGQQVTLRASGILRILPAGFLTAWLCGWAVAEWFALRLMASMLRTLLGWSFLARWFPPLGGQMPSGHVLPFFVGFLSLWLVLWTIGGAGALCQLMAVLFGRDVVRWGPDGLEITHWALLFRARAHLPAEEITGFRTVRGALVADGRKRATRITNLGSEDQLQQLGALLEAWRAASPPAAPLAPDRSPVAEFVAVRDETGAVALAPPPSARRSTGALLGLLGIALYAGVASVFTQKTGVGLVIGVLFLGVAGALCLYASLWLLAARETWHVGPGRLERRRVWFGRTWSVEFVPLELQVKRSTDSDGDTRWQLVATGAGRSQVILSAIDDPSPPLTLGTWLAERTGARLVRRDLDTTLRRAS